MIKKFVGLQTLDELPKPNFKWLVPNFIKEQTINQFFGAGGAGKTSLSLAIAKYALENSTIEQVIYIDSDNSIASLDDNSITKFATSYKNYFYYYANYDPKRFESDFLTQECLQNVLLVIDGTINFVDGGKLNSDESVIKFMQTLKELRAKGLTIIFQNHIAKHNTLSSKGNNQFENYSDENFKIERNDNIYTLTPKKFRIPNIKPLEIKVDKSNFEIKKINVCDELFYLSDAEKMTIKLSVEILDENKNGLNQKELTAAIYRLRDENHHEIVGKNNLWKLLDKFLDKLFIIQKGQRPHEKIYKISQNEQADKLKHQILNMRDL